jgi:peptidoglycan/LPS O-acetylase OafA/YrhL
MQVYLQQRSSTFMASLSNLDGIRALAVLMVVVCHLLLQLTDGKEPVLYSFRAMGHAGVAIFFVHTTFVLMASLERHGSAAIPFYVRRIFRIYPLSIVIVLFFALLQVSAHVPVDKEKFLSNLFLVQNITDDGSLPMPLWTLPFELQMYLVLPALYHMTRSRRPLMWTGVLYVCSMLVVFALPPTSLAWKVLRYVPCFIPGVLAFILCSRMQGRTSPMVIFGVVVGGGVVGIPMLAAAGVPELVLMWALCICIGWALPACRQLKDGYFSQGSKLIAKYSYGIYLTHVIALGAIDGLMPGPAIVQWAAMLILLPGLAYVCYHGIEKHGIALGTRLSTRLAESATERRQNQFR